MIDKHGDYVNAKVRMSFTQDATNATINTFPALVARVREALRGADRPDDDRAVRRWFRDMFWAFEDRDLIDYMIAVRNYSLRGNVRSLVVEAAARGVFLCPPGARA